MAKRKRLIPTPFETKDAAPLPAASSAAAPARSTPIRNPAPVAQVAGDASGSAALQEMADYIATARAEGRLLVSIPLHQIEIAHLQRDRLMPDDPASDDDMQALLDSLRARGQQVPIDVVRIIGDPRERYGLISGLRRVTALRLLHGETKETRFASVKARLVRPDGLPDAYRSMVEENEIRAGLSFYERARIAVKAVEAGAFDDLRAALRGLYGNVSRAKRSKIGSFVPLVQALDGHLRFPAALSEKRGLALAKALEAPGNAERLQRALSDMAPTDAEAERMILDGALRKQAKAKTSVASPSARSDGVEMSFETGRLTLSGPGVDDILRRDLSDWLKGRR